MKKEKDRSKRKCGPALVYSLDACPNVYGATTGFSNSWVNVVNKTNFKMTVYIWLEAVEPEIETEPEEYTD